MAINVHFDSAGAPLPLRLILATKAGNKIRELPINSVKFKDDFASGTEINFEVYKERCVNRNGVVDDAFWRRITDFKLAYCPEIDRWYELHVEVNERDDTMKAVQAISLGEAELSQINLYDMEVNTEDDIARDDYEPTVLYDALNPNASLIDRMLKKAPHYRVAHVDESIADIQRTFQFNGKSIYDAAQEVAKEIGCLFRFDCIKGNDGMVDRTVNVYDLENYCTSCGYRGDFTSQCEKCGSTSIRAGYGKNTTVFVAKENLADDVVYTTDTDSVKNCFRLEAGDDLMTATIINCNPNGSQYIWYISDEMMEDMSDGLKDRIEDYNELYDSYQNTYSFEPPASLVTQYNTIVNKYIALNPDLHTISSPIVGYPALMNAQYDTIDLQLYLNSGLMPNVEISSTDAATEAAKLTAGNLSPVAVSKLSSCTADTAANAVLGMAKCLIRSTFQVKVNNSSYNATTHIWAGNFTVTNYSDEEDIATSQTISVLINEDLETYIKQKLDRAMSKESDDATDISALFDLTRSEFLTELGKYSLQRLLSFRDACQASLDILIQQGVGDRDSWASQANDLYTNLYLPYRQKAADIEDEIAVRTNEIAIVAGVYDENGGIVIDGMQSIIDAKRAEIKEALDFEAYLGTNLWLEFASFRREDTFSNSNYISDGLDNAQLFALAQEFVAVAQKEIYRSAVLQHSIHSNLKNLLSMPEFSGIVNDFAVGNWIRVKVDGIIYRLRLSGYELDYDKWALSSVTFSDVKYGHSSASDISSLLDAIKSMQTSYGAVMRQAEQGEKSYSRMNNWSSEGFSLTTKIVGGAENQEFIMDETGFTGRELVSETEEYSDEQIKIIANGIYVTDDGWETVRAGLGKFTFWNPETQQYETRFGVIADTVVSPIILSQSVGIYNESGDVKINENGITIIADDSNNDTVFQILRRSSGGVLTSILSIDGNGNLVLSTYAPKSETIKDVEVQYALGDDDTNAPSSGWSAGTPQWTEGKYIWQRTKTTDGNNSISYSNPVCIQGSAGQNGVSITNVTNYYLATAASSGVTRSTTGWTTTVQTIDATNKYLWNYEMIAYSQGNPTYTDPAIIGVFGSDGSNNAIVNLYRRVSSSKTASGNIVSFQDGANGAPIIDLTVQINPAQSGSGDPSPDNVRPITGWTGVTVSHSGADTSDPETLSISWQTEAGTVYGGSLDVTTGVLTVTHGNISSYNGEELPGAWISSMDVYEAGATPTTGAQVVYELSTSLTYQNSPQEITTLTGANNIWANTGNISMEYQADPSLISVGIDWTDTLTYDFAQGALTSVPTGWSETIPTGEDPLYTTSARASSSGSIDTILYTEWSTPSLLAQGSNRIENIEDQYYLSSSNQELLGGSWSAGRTTWAPGKYLWQRSKVTWADGSVTYSIPAVATTLNDAYESINETYVQVETTESSIRTEIAENYVSQQQFIEYDGSLTESVRSGDLHTIIQETAGSVVESYGYEQSISTINSTLGTVSSKVESIDGEIRRGYIEDPSTGERAIGIAIAQNFVTTGVTKTDTELNVGNSGTIYEEFDGTRMRSLGIYTSTGWQFWLNGVKVGWFDSQDSMLHVTNEVVENSILISNSWSMTTDGGFGIRYIGG